MSEKHEAVYQMEIGNGNEHTYEVTLAYVFGDTHNKWANEDKEDRVFGWAEMEEHDAVIYKYHIDAYTIAEATARAIKIDDARKAETAATWPSVFGSMPIEPTVDELEKFYGFLVHENHFDDWFYQEPTSISCVLLSNKDMVHKKMENNVMQKAKNFTSDISEWMQQEEE